jgi:hypothetical protein
MNGSWLLILLVAGCAAASACTSRQLETVEPIAVAFAWDDRVVLVSPHFDEPIRGHGGLSCPAAPAQFFATTTSREGAESAGLTVQVEPFRGREVELNSQRGPIADAMVLVVPHSEGLDLRSSFPEHPTIGLTADSLGIANTTLPPGLYWVHVSMIGRRDGGALIQLGPSTQTLLRVQLDEQVLC